MLMETILRFENRNVKELLDRERDARTKMEYMRLKPHYIEAISKLIRASGAANPIQFSNVMKSMTDAAMVTHWVELERCKTRAEFEVFVQQTSWELLGVTMTEDEALAMRVIGGAVGKLISGVIVAKVTEFQ